MSGARKVDSRAGLGRALAATYAFLAFAACPRSAVQIATHFDQAPIAFLLSALSGAIYLLAAIALRRESRPWLRLGVGCCSVEMVGVIAVGLWSIAAPSVFPEPTVWSHFGSGYGFVPLVLPLLGLLWLRRVIRSGSADRREHARTTGAAA
jgi:cytochrome bd-type quinol oxidase subunit 2